MMKQTPTTLALLCVMGFVLVAVAPANGNGGESGSGSGDGDADVDTLSTTAFSSTTRGYNSCAAPAADFDMCYPTVSSPCVMGICFGSMCMQESSSGASHSTNSSGRFSQSTQGLFGLNGSFKGATSSLP